MSARTGLEPLEVALLEAVEMHEAELDAATAADLAAGHVPDDGEPWLEERGASTTRVLSTLETTLGLGPRHVYPLLVDLSVPWRRHLPLVDPIGNFGTQGDDPPADARYTEVRLSRVGRLGLLAGRPARIRLVCRVVRERRLGREALVITEVPLGSNPDEVARMIASRHDVEVRGLPGYQ